MSPPTSGELATRPESGAMGGDRAGHAEDDQDERNRAPPVLPESGQAMAALAPGPEDAK